jgi:hypothetical protein
METVLEQIAGDIIQFFGVLIVIIILVLLAGLLGDDDYHDTFFGR